VIVFFGGCGCEKKVGLVSVAAVVVVVCFVCVCVCVCVCVWRCVFLFGCASVSSLLLYLYAKNYVVSVSEYVSKELMKKMMVL
jgi:hypothetical protein